MNFVAIFTKEVFPQSKDKIVNKEFNTKKECVKFLEEERIKGGLSFWNPQIYNKKTKRYSKG